MKSWSAGLFGPVRRRDMAFVRRLSMPCDALRSPARRCVSVLRHGRDDRRHRKKGSVAAL